MRAASLLAGGLGAAWLSGITLLLLAVLSALHDLTALQARRAPSECPPAPTNAPAPPAATCPPCHCHAAAAMAAVTEATGGGAGGDWRERRVRPVLRWLHIDGGRDFFKAVTEGDTAARAAGALVVEVGAGDGKQAVETAALGYTVLSIDGSRGAVGQGKNLQRAATRAAGGALRGSLQWVHSAVGDRTGTATFLEHGGGIGRLLDAGDPAAVTHRDNPKWKGAKVTVPLNTLDDLLGNRTPYILKIDVEGHELNVLRGASGVLSRRPAIIILEFNPAMMRWSAGADACDLLDLLHSLGYDLYDAAISEPGHKGFLQRYRGAHHRPTGFRELVDWFNLSTRWDWWGAWTDIVALRPDQDQYVAPWP